MATPPSFINVDDPDHPGWMTWQLSDDGLFNSVLGKLLVRRDGDVARLRMFPERLQTNLTGNIHGGATLTFVDVALFAGAKMLGVMGAERGVTLDLSAQFIGAGEPGKPLDAEVELLRETGRLVFLRGIISQDHGKVAAFSATLRKATVR